MIHNAIEIENLSFHYGENAILDNINLVFPAGEFSVLLGRNGSGKSTLFNVVAGIEKYATGSVKLMGKERKKLPYAECASILGFLPQFHHPVFPFNVRDVVLTGRAAFSRFAPKASDMDCVEQAMEDLEISHLTDRTYTELSGGEKQLVMLARILVQNPAIIMLDEPTNHLDVYYQTYVMKKLRSLADRQFTVIAIMHDPNLAFQYADQCFFMKDKRIVAPAAGYSYYDSCFLKNVYNVNFETIRMKDKMIVMPYN